MNKETNLKVKLLCGNIKTAHQICTPQDANRSVFGCLRCAARKKAFQVKLCSGQVHTSQFASLVWTRCQLDTLFDFPAGSVHVHQGKSRADDKIVHESDHGIPFDCWSDGQMDKSEEKKETSIFLLQLTSWSDGRLFSCSFDLSTCQQMLAPGTYERMDRYWSD